MNTLLLLLLLPVFFYVIKSFMKYEEENPYRAKKPDYRHGIGNKKTATYDQMVQTEFGLIVALTAKVARADGRICELEAALIGDMLDQLSNYFDDPVKAREILKQILHEEKQQVETTTQIAEELYRYIQHDEQARLKILDFLINLAYADQHISEGEEKVLRDVAAAFHIDAQRFEAIIKQFKDFYSRQRGGLGLEESYQMLGAQPSDSFDEVKKKYRKLVREHHPDLIRGKGLGEEYVEEATKKLQEINAAYERIKKEKGE